jgi:hypothetical protein
MFHKAILLTAIKISTRSQNKVDYTSSQVLWESRYYNRIETWEWIFFADGFIYDLTGSVGLMGTHSIIVKIYYRFVKVNSLKYIGIIQSYDQLLKVTLQFNSIVDVFISYFVSIVLQHSLRLESRVLFHNPYMHIFTISLFKNSCLQPK